MTVRSTRTPRAILRSPQTFRIRHVPEPPATSATTLANLGLQNFDAFLASVETGSVRSLPGFKSGFHKPPTDHNDGAVDWIGRLKHDELKEELDEFFRSAKDALGFRRREGDVNLEGGDGGVDTPAFRYSVSTDQDTDDPAGWRVCRRLELRDGWEAQREEIQEAISGLDFDRFVVTFDMHQASYDNVADALEDMADREGKFDEYRGEKRLVYTRDDMSIIFDFAAGVVDFTVSGHNNLKLVDAARSISLGWLSPSPMLAAPAPPAALPGSDEKSAGGRKRKPPNR